MSDPQPVPPCEQWITFKQAAKMMNIPMHRLYTAKNDGRKSPTGENVKLECWRTLAGIVTTQEALNRFHRRISII